MKTHEFQPVFRSDVFVLESTGDPDNPRKFRILSGLCLSDDSAKDLASILEDLKPTIVPSSPLVGKMGGIFSVTSMVPGFVFPDGSTANCGDLAAWWTRCDPDTAERVCRAEILQKSKELQELADLGRTA